MTNITRTGVTPSAAQIAQGKYAFELSATRPVYGTELPAAMRVAALDGSPILYGDDATPGHPANDVTMNALAALVKDQQYIDDFWWAPVTSEANGRVRKIYALRPTSAAGALSTGGGPVLGSDPVSQRPVLDFSVAAFSGFLAPLDPLKVAAASTAKTLIHIGKHNARPANSPGSMLEVVGGSNNTRLVGMGTNGTKWQIGGQRLVGTAASAVTLSSTADSIVGEYFEATSCWDIANATVQMSVNGTEVIQTSAWGTGNVGSWLPSNPNTARLCWSTTSYPGVGVLWMILNTVNPTIVNRVRLAARALEPSLLP